MTAAAAREAFVRAATEPGPVPFVPEITLRMAADPFRLWERTEAERPERRKRTGRSGPGRVVITLPPPFWAFPWAGGQGLARYILDHPGTVAGRSVLDIASGSGLVAIAAAKAGAAQVMASDIDPLALAVIKINAEANAVVITPSDHDLLSGGVSDHDGAGPASGGFAGLVLAADAFYERDLARRILRFLRGARAGGADVLAADPDRAFLPRGHLTAVMSYDVPVIREIEDSDVKHVTVYKLRC
jgi:predicted nicotinamide N-methyase